MVVAFWVMLLPQFSAHPDLCVDPLEAGLFFGTAGSEFLLELELILFPTLFEFNVFDLDCDGVGVVFLFGEHFSCLDLHEVVDLMQVG